VIQIDPPILDNAAKAAGESRMAYIRKAVEERMERSENSGRGSR